MVVVYILHYFSKHFTRAMFIEETNSLAQILCTCKHEKRITLIMNKMLVAFAFRPLAVFKVTAHTWAIFFPKNRFFSFFDIL